MRTGRPPKTPKATFTCEQCGNQWEAYPWNLDRQKYCSRECFSKSRIGRPHPGKIIPEQRRCARCGGVFLIGGEGNRKAMAKYCSRTCARHGYWGDAVHKPAKQLTEIEAAWFAGLFDGEGSIRWSRRSVIHSVALNVTNTNQEIMQRVIMVTGTGKIVERPPKKRQHSLAYRWECYGDNARIILRQILPWLIIKRDAAETALGLNNATEPPWTQRSKSMRAAE